LTKELVEKRLSLEDGVDMFENADVLELGRRANAVRESKNGNVAYYVVNRHVNYTNICVNRCRFCAFSRSGGEAGAYELTMEQILGKADEAGMMGATELHIVGGLHPSWPFSFYVGMLAAIKKAHPGLHLQAFTAVEIDHFTRMTRMTARDVLTTLKEAGLGSLPGGGAEIFADRARRQICPTKLGTDGWIYIMREAHELGIRSNATMLYGHVETFEERVDHLLRLRDLQEETGGFDAFIPLPFHPRNTQMPHFRGTGGIDDLRTIAISRLILDNFDHIKAFWIMLGTKLAQVSLSFGADDLDGTVVEEKITHFAGAQTPEALSREELVSLIKEAGREPVERDTVYNPVNRLGRAAR
jgi:aminodeoxyfutalosine synthase